MRDCRAATRDQICGVAGGVEPSHSQIGQADQSSSLTPAFEIWAASGFFPSQFSGLSEVSTTSRLFCSEGCFKPTPKKHFR